jgi:hypothetical protein
MTCQHQLGISSQLGIESSDAIDSCSDFEIQFENSCYVDVGLKSKTSKKFWMKSGAHVTEMADATSSHSSLPHARQAMKMLGYAFALIPIYFFVYLPISHMLYGTTLKPSNPNVTDFNFNVSSIASDEPLSCPPHTYSTYILSQEPLIIYIENFLSKEESVHFLKIRYCSMFHSDPDIPACQHVTN